MQISGWPRLSDVLQDIWTPDVKANQLADVISGVAPIRSVVNVGTGMADLVLLPIEQYRRDGRVTRGIQKGASSFFRSTALEAVKLGARLATGTQVVLERAETVFGGGGGSHFDSPLTVEAIGATHADPGGGGTRGEDGGGDEGEDRDERFSKWAAQPADVREGIESAYKSLSGNLRSAAQTILAVPIEVYERSGTDVRTTYSSCSIAREGNGRDVDTFFSRITGTDAVGGQGIADRCA
jgi:autophagy-related protein 2